MIFVYIILLVFFAMALYIPVPWGIGKIVRLHQKAKAIKGRKVYLTFDDGPGTRLTPQILTLLEEKGIKATFFLLGRNVSGKEDILEAVARQGHAIASHSYNHFNAWKVSPHKGICDIRKGWDEVNRIFQTKNKRYPYRPPNGKLTLFSLLYLWYHKVPIIFWSVDCRDTKTDFQSNIGFASERIQNDQGGVVLFHDFDRTTDGWDASVLESIKAVIETGQKMKLEFSVFKV